MKWLVLPSIFLGLAMLLTLAGPPAAAPTAPMRDPGMERPSHHTDTGFRNPWPGSSPEHGFKEFFKWRRTRKDGTRPRYGEVVNTLPLREPRWEIINAPGGRLVVTWLGHAAFLIQMDGLNILTDPNFSERASPVQFAGPRRVTPLPVEPDRLPPIDVVVISHNHYDHLDKGTVRRLGNGPTWYVPLGLKGWFARQGVTRVVELDWWDRVDLKAGREIICVPAKHFSSRTLWDRNETLWAGWVLASPDHRVYFAGDTGYSQHFADIGERAGPLDLALLPIGAYNPEWFMSSVHITPDQAVQAHRDLSARRTIGMHWGTFILTDEPFLEPPRRLRESAARAGLSAEEVLVMEHGETLVLP
ncbi:MAG: MBL fold metallo-hydrolase [Candidatus Marinimicrobia bacterium]|nr:MBL fold metallo-hydrolase [Candidatus Neomarinimicrobiota bacterium]